MSIGQSVPRVPGMTRIQAEEIARKIVGYFQPELLSIPGRFPSAQFFEFHLVEKYGLNTGTADLPLGIEGVTRPSGQIRIASHVYEAMLDEIDGRSRFTPVHEAVHGIVHLTTLRRLQVDLVENVQSQPQLFRRDELPPYADPEWQANRVAGAILMPYEAVLSVFKRYGGDPREIVRAFGVSRAAAETRLGHLTQLGWLS